MFESLDVINLLKLNSFQKLNIVEMNNVPNININQINKYIYDKNRNLSYSFQNYDNKFDYNGEYIYAMHSIGKIFTGFVIILLLYDKTIDENMMHEPIQLEKTVLNKLDNNARTRLKDTNFLDVMTHYSGLDDFMENYINAIKNKKIENIYILQSLIV